MELKYCFYMSLLMVLCVFFSCENKSTLQKVGGNNTSEVIVNYDQPSWVGSFLDLGVFDRLDTASFVTQESEPLLTILYYFRGDCSSCIASFIEWQAQWKMDELNTKEIGPKFVSRTSDADLLMHYLRVAEVELKNSLFLDGEDIIAQSNDIIGESDLYTQIFLIDIEGKVLAYGDPLSFQNVREIYSKSLIR